MNFLILFLITIILEFIVYSIFIRKDFLYLLLISILINALTWPTANLVYSFFPYFFTIELCVFIIEGFLIKSLLKINYSKAFLISLVANLVTLLLGKLI